MTSPDDQTLDDRRLTLYLLGALPEKESEHLDELSITDREFAGRLDALEHDLVDVYVRGELYHNDLKQFEATYCSSPRRRQKVEFAEGLVTLERRTAATASVERERALQASAKDNRPSWRALLRPRFALNWGFAVAFMALLVIGGYLLVQNLQLRKQILATQAHQASHDQTAQELEKQLRQERAAKDEALKELEQAHQSQSTVDQIHTFAMLLPSPRRGAGQLPTISLRRGTDLVVLVLPLETNDFAAYLATLRDPGSNRVLWSSARLMVSSGGERKTISVTFPASLLKTQNYIVDLAGIPSHGASEVFAGYPFRAVLQ